MPGLCERADTLWPSGGGLIVGGYSSAFDDLLASGRDALDKMTGRADGDAEEAPVAQPAGDEVIEGTARGIPFRLRVR